MLAERRGLVNDHPLRVATTWKLSFEQVEQKSQAGADLLQVCAFLAPDSIPEWMIVQGAEELGPNLEKVGEDEEVLEKAVEALLAYSLMKRDVGRQMMSVHRLVQAVVRDGMKKEEQSQWAERVVLAVNAAFPYVEHKTRARCEELLPHGLLCTQWIEQYQMKQKDAAQLLKQVAYYLQVRARYQQEAEWVQRTTQGDQEAFDKLFQISVDFVYGYFFSRLGSISLAEALTSKTLTEATRMLVKGRYKLLDKPFRVWIYTIAKNVRNNSGLLETCQNTRT